MRSDSFLSRSISSFFSLIIYSTWETWSGSIEWEEDVEVREDLYFREFSSIVLILIVRYSEGIYFSWLLTYRFSWVSDFTCCFSF